MTITLAIISLAIAALAFYVVAANWWCIVKSLLNKRDGINKHHSTVPLISFFLAAAAGLIFPFPEHRPWFLAIAALDLSNWLLLLMPFILFRDWLGKRPRR